MLHLPYLILLALVLFGLSHASTTKSDIKTLNLSLVFSTDLISDIVPYENDQKIFILPDNPPAPTIAKLVYTVDSHSKKIEMLTFTIIKFSHNDLACQKLFESVIQSFNVIAELDKSIKMKSNPEAYLKVSGILDDLIKVLLAFLKTFSSSLAVHRLSEVEVFKKIILQNLEGIFYVMSTSEDDFEILMDLIFSAVGSTQDEQLVWNFYKIFASPSLFLPVPHEFLVQGYSQEISSSLFQDLMEIFSREEQKCYFDSAWLPQLGLLIRFRLISNSEALELVKKMINYPWNDSKEDCFNLISAMSLIFVDDLVQNNQNKCVVNYLNKPAPQYHQEDLKTFYIEMWSVIISKVLTDFEKYEEFNEILSSVLHQLEYKFPNISDDLNLAAYFVDDSNSFSNFMQAFNALKIQFSSQEEIDIVTNFLKDDFTLLISELAFDSIRSKIDCIMKKLIEVIRNITDCLSNNSTQLNFEDLLDTISITLFDSDIIELFASSFSDESQVILFVDFVFKLSQFSQTQFFVEFLLDRINGNTNLLSVFYCNFARNLFDRPDFFCLSFDPKQDEKQFTEQILDSFFDEIIEIPRSGPLLLFVASAYLFGYLDHSRLWSHLDKVQAANIKELPDIAASITDISSFEFSKITDTLEVKLSECQSSAIKIFDLFTRFDYENLDEIYFTWICIKLVSFESLKPETRETDQLAIFTNLESNDLVLKEFIQISLQLISKLIHFGASENDLKRVFVFFTNFKSKFLNNFENRGKFKIAYATAVVLLIFIIRANENIVSKEIGVKAMQFFSSMNFYEVSITQLIFKAYKNPEFRSFILPNLFDLVLTRLDFSFTHDPNIFDGMSEANVETHIKSFIRDTFTSEGVVCARLETFCFWLSLGLVPSDVALKFIKKITTVSSNSTNSNRKIATKYSISIIRSIFTNEKYRSLRTLTVKRLFTDVDHLIISPRPFMFGIIGGVIEFTAEPEFIAALDINSDSRVIILSELARKDRVSCHSLVLSDGIENVTNSYSQFIIDLTTFNMSLPSKNIVFDSIFINLRRITRSENDYLDSAFTKRNLDYFVRIAVYLATQIHSDSSEPLNSFYFDRESIDLFCKAIIQYVQDVKVQSLLIYHIFGSIKDNSESRLASLEIVPQYINWRRFPLLSETFRFIFNFNVNAEIFDKFMISCIDSAFTFSDLSQNDAQDLSRNPNLIKFVNEMFFSTMTLIILQYNLPVKYILHTLKLLNENSDKVEINSTSLVQFLRTSIKNRIIESDSQISRITKKSYGSNPSYNSSEETFVLVLAFLNKRPDFLTVAFVNDRTSGPFNLIHEIDALNTVFNSSAYNLPTYQLIRSIFIWPNSGLESLQWISRVKLSDSTIRSIVSWISISAPKVGDNVIPVVMIVLNLVPLTFDLDSYLDSTGSLPWMPISISILDWVDSVLVKSSQQFASKLTERAVDAYLNIILWSLDFDKVEKISGIAFLNFLQAITLASDSIKFHFLQTLNIPYYRPILVVLSKNSDIFFKICSLFRVITFKNFNLANKVEKLAEHVLKNNDANYTEDEIMIERRKFMKSHNELDDLDSISNISDFFNNISKNINQLRLMNEFDLIFLFLSKISAVTKELLKQDRSVRLESIALSVTKILLRIVWEMLLQADFEIFKNIFSFIYKHAPAANRTKFVSLTEILLSQFFYSSDIQAVLNELVQNLRLEACFLPSKGLPKHFYPELKNEIICSYFDKLNSLGYQQHVDGQASLDVFHLIVLFNILHNVNSPDKYFKGWVANMLRVHGNDVITEDFAVNLKDHCLTRKHLIKDLIPVLIKSELITQVFEGPHKETMLAVYKLIFKDSPEEYQNQLKTLPVDLQSKMNEAVDEALIEKKRKVVLSIVERCALPENSDFKFESLSKNLLSNLEMVFKLDLKLLPQEQFSTFFDRLKLLFFGLSKNLTFGNQIQSLNLIAIGFAIQIKNEVIRDSSNISLILQVVVNLNLKPEVLELIAREAAKVKTTYSIEDMDSIVGILNRVFDPRPIFIQFLNNPRINTSVLIKKIIKSSAMNLDLSLIIQNHLIKLASEKNLNRELFEVAMECQLLSKSQILLFDLLIN